MFKTRKYVDRTWMPPHTALIENMACFSSEIIKVGEGHKIDTYLEPIDLDHGHGVIMGGKPDDDDELLFNGPSTSQFESFWAVCRDTGCWHPAL